MNDENTELRQIHFTAKEGFNSIVAGKGTHAHSFCRNYDACVRKNNNSNYDVIYGRINSLTLLPQMPRVKDSRRVSSNTESFPLPKSPSITRNATRQ